MSKKKWVAGWGTSVSITAQNHAEYFKDQTFRYVIFPTVDADAVRLHFSNEYGTEAITISKTFVAKRTENEFVDPATNACVTFGGKQSVTIEAGATVVSDEIPFSFKAGEEFDVSMYFAELTLLRTGHSNGGYYIKKYFGKGDWADKAAMPLDEYGEGGPYVFLNTIDFLCDEKVHAIVAFGDSITAQPWPDCLAHRLFDAGVRDVCVVRKAIGGGRILRDYTQRIKMHWGAAGIKRFERDVCRPGVDRVFILHGINDLYHPQPGSRFCGMEELPTFDEIVENGYKKYIEIARKHGIKIYMSPILPCSKLSLFEGEREALRQRINEWIRNEAEIDGVIDFETAVWNPDNHLEYLPEYDSGDHLHPSFAGATHMAESISMDAIEN